MISDIPSSVLLNGFTHFGKEFNGGLVGIFLIYFRNQHSGLAIPFGPYLAGGGLIAMFWGKQINHSYLSLF